MKMFLVLAAMLFCRSLLAESPAQWGSYPNRPLALQDVIPPDGRRFSLLHDFNYIDPGNREWEAPTGLVVDGASIPMPFWSVIGGPFEGLYREASVVHDAGCCAQMQPWQDVHHMFYNAMRCSGVGWVKGKTMFLAVWAFGPRWKHLNSSMPPECKTEEPSRTPGVVGSWTPPRDLDHDLWREIVHGTLSLAEAKAVARPFFTQGAMTDTDALALVGKLQERIEVTPEERRIILLSVIQSELISDEEVMQLELWIEQANPSMKVIESKAEQFRNRRITELRLFPNVRGLLKTANDYRVGSPSVTPWTMIIILNAFGVAVALVFLGLRRTVT